MAHHRARASHLQQGLLAASRVPARPGPGQRTAVASPGRLLRVLAAGIGALVILATGSGCGNAVVPVAGRAPVATVSPSAASTVWSPAPSASGSSSAPSTPSPSVRPEPTPAPSTLQYRDRQIAGWPAGVTLPLDTTVVSVTADGRTGAVTLAAPARIGLADQIRGDLRRAGLEIDDDAAGSYGFRAPGWRGQVVSDESTVLVTWTVGEGVAGRHGDDLGLETGVPRLLAYPVGATATHTKVQATGSSYDLVGRSPTDLLAYYRLQLPPLFVITGDRTEDGVTTVTYTDRVYDSVITATDTSFRVVHTRRR